MEVQKKPRGRPSIKPKVIPVKGVVGMPLNESNWIELVHNNPELLKCLYRFYDKTKINNIFIGFRKNHIVFSGENEDKDVTIETIIDCAKVPQYYCDEPRYFRLGRQLTQGIVNCIVSKYFPEFRICYNDCKQFFIVLINSEIDSYREYSIKPLVVPPIVELQYNLSEYMLKFTLDDKVFTKYMKDASVISEKIVIKKTRDTRLEFSCQDDTGNIMHNDVFRNDTAVGLKENYGNEHGIHRMFSLAPLVKVTSAVIAKRVTFYLNQSGPLILEMVTDETTKSVVMIN